MDSSLNDLNSSSFVNSDVNQSLISDVSVDEFCHLFKSLREQRQSHPGVILAHLNINGLLSKFDWIGLLLRLRLPDILCLSETKIDESVTDATLSVSGYEFFRNDRDRQGGGLCMYISSCLPCKRVSAPSFPGLERLLVSVQFMPGVSSVVGALYRPPSGNVTTTFTEALTSCMDYLYSQFSASDVTLLGDLNVDFLSLSSSVFDGLELLQLKNLVTSATRVTSTSISLLDVILATTPSLYGPSASLDSSSISDHNLVCVTRLVPRNIKTPVRFSRRKRSSSSEDDFVENLGTAPWSLVSTFDSLDDQWATWKSIFWTF